MRKREDLTSSNEIEAKSIWLKKVKPKLTEETGIDLLFGKKRLTRHRWSALSRSSSTLVEKFATRGRSLPRMAIRDGRRNKRQRQEKKNPVKASGADPPNVTSINRQPDENSGALKIGQTIVVKWKDGSLRNAKIIERKLVGPDKAKPENFKYYVHFHDFNRRMDDWIKYSKIKKLGPLSPKTVPSTSEPQSGEDPGIRTRGQKRTREEDEGVESEHDEHEGMDAASLKEHEEVTKVKNIRKIQLGRHTMETWYFSPFPKEYYAEGTIDTLYICEFCLKFFRYRSEFKRHVRQARCPRHPPGNEIYRHDGISTFEVDGSHCKEYCQNLCYIAKLFLDHKTLYYDVDPFLFYVVCEMDSRGFHVVGYFSKEKYSEQGYNLACILTLPSHQKKGYGNFLISFSYELSKKEQKVGSPEKPLSDLGLVSYRSYWSRTLLSLLKDYDSQIVSVIDLTKKTSIKTEDVISTLQHLGIIKYWNGQYILAVPRDMVQEMLTKMERKKYKQVDPEKLHWAPLVVDMKRDKWSIKAKKPTAEDL